MDFQKRPLAERELAQIRGGQALFSGGRGGTTRLAQDATMREFILNQNAMTQQFDNWFSDVGAQLIAANLLR